MPTGVYSDRSQGGIATLVSVADKTDVVLYATADISEANHIHTGKCATLGGVANPLTNMAGGKSVTTVNVTLNSLRTGNFAINLHKKGQASVYTACGDIPAASGGTTSAGGTAGTVAEVSMDSNEGYVY